jgi:hypothetical protein|tara:strand:+ start:246 stop:446 length:201 start_codon:yes stop_codon:yes gene_type:complete
MPGFETKSAPRGDHEETTQAGPAANLTSGPEVASLAGRRIAEWKDHPEDILSDFGQEGCGCGCGCG